MRSLPKLNEMRIMLIDDDEWIRDSLGLFFEAEGCRFVALETAEEGIEALKQQPYDIIITDYRLPAMDGLEFFRRIRNSHPSALRILVTAYRTRAVAAEAMRLGVHGLIDKPLDGNTIMESLVKWMEQREERREEG